MQKAPSKYEYGINPTIRLKNNTEYSFVLMTLVVQEASYFMPIVHLSVPIKEFEILACIIFN
jgi:hypothetical protein